MLKKYKFVGEKKEVQNTMLQQIQYTRSFAGIVAGQMGGFVEGEHNLSHEGNCFISEGSFVFGNARVTDDAIVKGVSMVKDNARVQEKSKIENSIIGADTIIMNDSWILNSAIQIFESTRQEVYGVMGSSKIVGSSIVATGAIFGSRIENKNLTGILNPFM